MKNHWFAAGGALALLFGTALFFGTALLHGDDPPQDDRPGGPLMRGKLRSSRMVLEGLVTEDFDMIARGAREMKRISLAGEWSRTRDSVYEHYSSEFRRQCTKLEDLALQENRDGVSFTYLHLTMLCLNCHERVRQPDFGAAR